MLDELYNSHKFNIDIFSYSSSINLGTGYEAFTCVYNVATIQKNAYFLIFDIKKAPIFRGFLKYQFSSYYLFVNVLIA